MNAFRRASLVLVLACAGSAAMWARREWGFVLMVSRFLRLGPPPTIHAPWYCEKLIETMPADVLERLPPSIREGLHALERRAGEGFQGEGQPCQRQQRHLARR